MGSRSLRDDRAITDLLQGSRSTGATRCDSRSMGHLQVNGAAPSDAFEVHARSVTERRSSVPFAQSLGCAVPSKLTAPDDRDGCYGRRLPTATATC